MKQTIPAKEILEIINKQLDILKILSAPRITLADDPNILGSDVLASGTMTFNPNYKKPEDDE